MIRSTGNLVVACAATVALVVGAATAPARSSSAPADPGPVATPAATTPEATTPATTPGPTTPASTTPTEPRPIDAGGQVTEMQAEGRGLRLAIVGNNGEPAIKHLDTSGRTVRQEGLFVPGTAASAENAVLTPDGGAALYAPGGKNDEVTLHVSTLSNGTYRAQRVSPLGRQAIPQTPLVAGPTGALAVGWYEGRAGRRTVLRMAFRPAGATTFRKPVDISRPVRGIDSMAIALGPDGGGAVFALPDIYDEKRPRPTMVRQISRSGRIGPSIALPVGLRTKGGRDWRTQVQAGLRRDGTLFAALLSVGFDAAERDRSRAWFVALGKHATKPSRVQHLADDGTRDSFGGNLALRVDRRDRAVVVVDRAGGKGLAFYEGTAKGVRRSRGFDPGDGASTRLGALPDGHTVAAWIGATTDRQLGFLASSQSSAGRFRAPSLIPGSGAAFTHADRLRTVVGLPGNLIATAWSTEEDSFVGGGDLLLITPRSTAGR
jgi:hypothetical protein